MARAAAARKIAVAADEATKRRQSKFAKPADAAAPTGQVVVVMATGGTFLGRAADETKSPQYYKDFWTFIEACNLEQGAIDRGFYQNAEGDIFDRDGRRIIYMPSDPSIDSTDATSEGTRVGFLNLIETSKRDHTTDVGVEIVQGTDTGANTASTLDLVYGRDTHGGVGVVSSQKTADAPRSDGPENFWICYDGIAIFRQVIVPSNSGRVILPGNIRKKADNSFEIYMAAEGGIL